MGDAFTERNVTTKFRIEVNFNLSLPLMKPIMA